MEDESISRANYELSDTVSQKRRINDDEFWRNINIEKNSHFV